MTARMKLFVPLVLAYVALVVLANWLASKYLITVPFTHYLAPAGVLAVGAVLVMRDWVQQLATVGVRDGDTESEKRGVGAVLVLIVVAGLLSLALAFIVGYKTPPGATLLRVSLASLAAFAVSEGIFETAIFTPLRKRWFTAGVALSATAGNAIDSLVFLAIAFPAAWTTLYAGNFIGKLEMIILGVAVTAARRYFLPTKATAAA